MQTVEYVDIQKFMGDWHVVAHIPTYFEKNAYQPVEKYALNEDGTIATTFAFRDKSVDGPFKEMHARGFIQNTQSNAVWGMQFLWPIKADYRIVYLDNDYRYSIIARSKRDYLWIMARDVDIPTQKLDELIGIAVSLGYVEEDIRIVAS